MGVSPKWGTPHCALEHQPCTGQVCCSFIFQSSFKFQSNGREVQMSKPDALRILKEEIQASEVSRGGQHQSVVSRKCAFAGLGLEEKPLQL